MGRKPDKTAEKLPAALNPKRHTVWSLERVHDLLTAYFFEIYEQRLHPAHGMTPAQAFERGVQQGGTRQTRKIPYDEDFMMMTLPTTGKGVAKVQRTMGMKINYTYMDCGDNRPNEIAPISPGAGNARHQFALRDVHSLNAVFHRSTTIFIVTENLSLHPLSRSS